MPRQQTASDFMDEDELEEVAKHSLQARQAALSDNHGLKNMH